MFEVSRSAPRNTPALLLTLQEHAIAWIVAGRLYTGYALRPDVSLDAFVSRRGSKRIQIACRFATAHAYGPRERALLIFAQSSRASTPRLAPPTVSVEASRSVRRRVKRKTLLQIAHAIASAVDSLPLALVWRFATPPLDHPRRREMLGHFLSSEW